MVALLYTQAELDVISERRRQVAQERWTAEGDDEHRLGELACAAAAYAGYSAGRIDGCGRLMSDALRFWPFAFHWWKPKDQRRDLVRAAALIIAEIERIDRAAAKAGA